MTKHQPRSVRQYPRTARLNELVREIVADELERLDDDRLQLVTVTSVEVEPDLHNARVWFDAPGEGERDEEIAEALGDVRAVLQAAIARQARMKRTPTLTFRPDDVLRSALRIERILREEAARPPREDQVDDGSGPPD